MIKALLFFGLFSASLSLQGCNKITANEQSVINPPVATPTIAANTEPKIENPKTDFQTVNFKGVSFVYNPQVFGEARMEEVAEHTLQEETDKPDGVEPQHRLFTFDLSTDYSPMEISVYPINDFPRMYAVNKLSVKSMQKEINDFKRVLTDKTFRGDYNQIPYLPFRDAGQTFQVKVKHFPFQGGRGILFLTFWDTQIEFPSNRQLRYVFEGLTNDGKYYILAEMPISVAFLPEDSSDEYEGYKIPWGKGLDTEALMKRIAEVNKKVGERLETLPQDEFKPNPKYFEEIISSLKVEK